MSGKILNILGNALYEDDSITRLEFHSHFPYTTTSFNNNDEIRLPVNHQDAYTLPCESYLHIKLLYTDKDDAYQAHNNLISNAVAYLFDEIRYEINGSEIDRVKNVGITTTMKNLLTIKPSEVNSLENACWSRKLVTHVSSSTKEITFCIPLKMLLGFAEDYKRILLNVKQELILIRASSDMNAIILPTATATAPAVTEYKFNVKNISWRVPYVHVSDEKRLELLRLVDRDQPITVPFRKWEIYEYPSAPQAQQLIWTVKTTAQSDKPRYVIVGFQTDRKNNIHKNPANFDLVALRNIKLYLNSQYYPYDNINGDKMLLHEYYRRFQSSYYYGSNDEPMLDYDIFIKYTPLCVIDCSKQNESLKTGSIDVRLEIETSENLPSNTAIYCLIIYDTIMQYTPLSGTVRKSVM